MPADPRVEELIERILESNANPEDACWDCPELLSEVLQRLERMRRVELQIDSLFPPAELNSGDRDNSPHSSGGELPLIDGYDVEGVVGHGGMGVVYKARHLKLNRIVALKMLLAGQYAGSQARARFVRESQAVADLQHPHIVQIHDVGDLDGRPYFTMEFVEGGNLAQELAGAPQPARRAAEWVADLAGAVHLAHTKGIIHRDLKPANILLSGDGLPKIADFGLARYLDGGPSLTISDARVGTPSYMAPEQALGKLGTIGPSVDIYALGAVLYEMLTGRPPFRAETAIETERQVITVEAAPPSRLNANVPRDLETICLKCLHKDPSRRYASAAELGDDVRRFLNGQPILARPVGVWERAWRWGARNRAVAAALAGMALLLMLIVIGSLWAAAHFRQLEGEHRQLAKEKGDLADEKGRLAVEKERERAKAVSAEEREAGLRRRSEAQGEELRHNLYLTEMNLAGQAATVPGGLGRVAELLERWGQRRPDLRNWEWYYLNSLGHRSLLTRTAHADSVQSLAWSPSGARLASGSSDRTICIWDAADKQSPLRLTGHTREVFSVAWSPDGQRLASASWDRTVRVWDATIGNELFRFQGHEAEVHCVAWSADGNSIASGGKDKTIHIWNATDGTARNVLRGHTETVGGLSWAPDSRRLASASRDATARVWDVAAGKATHTLGHANWVNQVAWRPDGSRLASVSNDELLRIWDLDHVQEPRILRGHTQGVSSVVWSPDGTRLATSSEDLTVRVWTAATGAEAFSLRGHTDVLTSVAWNPQGDRLASAGFDRAIKIWDAATGPETPAMSDHGQPVQTLAWCQKDAKLCTSADSTGVVKIWDLARHVVRWTMQGDSERVYSVAWNPGGTRLAAASENGLIRIWHVASDEEPEILNGHADAVCSVAWSPDGRRLASGGFDNTVRIWDVTGGKSSRAIKNHQHFVYSVAWDPDSRRVASASGDGTVKIWDLATDEEVLCYRGHRGQVVTVAWSPDGTLLASAGYDRNVHLWDAATGQLTSVLRGHTTHIAQVIWSLDGTRLASAGRDGTVKVWDAQTGKEALTLNSHASQVSGVAWSPDGLILASSGTDHQIRIHDATAGYFAARSPQLLPAIDRRLAADPTVSADWRMRAEIRIRQQAWNQAAVDLRQYLLLKPRPAWFLSDGVVAGPYPEDLSGRCPPEETEFFDAKTFDGDESESPTRVNWKPASNNELGLIDFGPYTDYRDHVSAYALFPIYCLEDHRIAILLGTDDQARLWLNGEQLYESLRSRVAIADEDGIPATLKSGWNSLLVRVANETRTHLLYLRLSDADVDLARVRGGAR